MNNIYKIIKYMLNYKGLRNAEVCFIQEEEVGY